MNRRYLISPRFWLAVLRAKRERVGRDIALRFCRLPGIRDIVYFPQVKVRRHPDYQETMRVHRYGVMPDGNEIDLGPTVKNSQAYALSIYKSMLRLSGFRYLAPVVTEGTDFVALPPRITNQSLNEHASLLVKPSDPTLATEEPGPASTN